MYLLRIIIPLQEKILLKLYLGLIQDGCSQIYLTHSSGKSYYFEKDEARLPSKLLLIFQKKYFLNIPKTTKFIIKYIINEMI